MYHHIFLRHLATDKNAPEYNESPALQEKVLATENYEIPVNPEGHRQGKVLEESFGEYLCAHHLQNQVFLCIHSGYKRTKVTLDYVFRAIRRCPVHIAHTVVDPRIRDIDHGEVNDLPYEQAREQFPAYAAAIDAIGYLDAVPPGGETYRQALKRIRSYIRDLEQLTTHTITVTHLSTIVLIRWVLEGLSDNEVLELLSRNNPPNGSATHNLYDPIAQRWSIREIQKQPWNN